MVRRWCGGRGLGGKREDQAVEIGRVGFQVAGGRDWRGMADGALGLYEVATGGLIHPADEGFSQGMRRHAGRIYPAGRAGVDQNPERLGAVHAGAVAPARGEQEPRGLSGANGGQVIPHGTPYCLGKGHPASFDRPLVRSPAPFEVTAGNGDLMDDISAVPDLADRQRKELLDPVARGAAKDQEQAGAVGGCEVLGEREVFGFGEGTCAHAHKMAPPTAGAGLAPAQNVRIKGSYPLVGGTNYLF